MRRIVWRQIRCHHRNVFGVLHTTQYVGWLGTRTTIVTSSLQSRSFNSLNSPLNSDPSFFNTEVDSGFVRHEHSIESILERARIHGIETLERLAYEADLGRVRSSGARLLDDDAIRQDLDLWAIVLDYRYLKDGPNGVQDVLSAMLHGSSMLKLQSDSVSGHIWRTILPVVLNEEKLLFELCRRNLTSLQERPLVFADIVGQLLAVGNSRLAIVYGTQHLVSHFRGHVDLIHLFDIVFRMNTKDALLGFCQLLSRLPLYRIYADTVPRLWTAGREDHALLLHRHLMSLGDYPSSFDQIEPLVQELAVKNVKIEPFLHHLERHGIMYSHQARRLYFQERLRLAQDSTKANKIAFSAGPGTRPVKLSDAFVARTFATRSVSFDFVLSGLIFIGLFEIGPLAVRELALAAGSIEEMQRRFKQLEKMNVDLGASNFVRIVKNLCISGREDLLGEILRSDMHHDVFEDVQKQKRLLNGFFHGYQWSEVSRTLASLTGGETNEAADFRSARLILQTALIKGDWRAALMILDNMREDNRGLGCFSELAPLRLALRRIWSGIEAKMRTSTDYLDRHPYLVGFLQLSHLAGLRAYPWQWRSVLHAVGRSGDWSLFRRLIFSLTRTLQTEPQPPTSNRDGQRTTAAFTLSDAFDEAMQSLVLEVSLISGIEGNDPQEIWLRGVRLLQSLRQIFHIDMDYHTISSAFQARLQNLFDSEDAGTQRRLVNLYLGCFNWAWSEVVSPTGEKLPHSLYQRGLTTPDLVTVQLFRLRYNLVWQRRYPSHSYSDASTGQADAEVDEASFVDGAQTSSHTTNPEVGHEEDYESSPVFYEDLLHPSYVRAKHVQQ